MEYYCNHPTGRQQNTNDTTFLIFMTLAAGTNGRVCQRKYQVINLSMNWNEVSPFSHEDSTVDGTPRLDTTL